MNKAIILLSGTTPSRFIEIAKKSSWVWHININNFLGSRKNEFYWDGEEGQFYNSFTHEFFALIYKYFTADDNEVKVAKGKVFTKFLLVVHGVSDNLVSTLKDEYGVFKIHLSNKERNENDILNDVVLSEDNGNFEEEVNKLIYILTSSNEKELV